tara:strand:+ start:31 stop:471 length:441 start_codon:yes stop_codon:yes gene_type:complete
MRPFIFSVDAEAIKSGGSPSTLNGELAFNQLIEDAREMIVGGVGDQGSLPDLITEKLITLSTQRHLLIGSDMPEAMKTQLTEDSVALAESIADSVSFAMVATIINFLGSTTLTLDPLLSFSMTPADSEQQVPIPLNASASAIPRPL